MKKIKAYIINIFKKPEIISIIFLAILSIANRYPLLSQISTHVYFNGADYNIYTWVLAWDCHAIEKFIFNNFWATNAMYPYPYVLAFSENLTGLLPIAFPIWILSHNPILTFNLTLLILLFSTAISSYLVLRKMIKSDLPALIGSVIFSFYPYNLWNFTIGHPHMVALMLLPIITYVNILYWEEDKIRYLTILVLLWIWNFLMSIYIGIMILLYLAIWNLIWFMREKEIFKFKKIVKWLIGISLVWVAMVPVFYIYYQVVRDMDAIRTLEHHLYYTGYAWSWFSVPPDNVIWGKFLKILPSPRFIFAEDAMFPGIIPFLLFIASYLIKDIPYWLKSLRIASLIIAILAIGPYMIGISEKVPMPYTLIWYIFPPLRALRNPQRLSVFVILGIGFIAAFVANKLIKKGRYGVALSLVILLLHYVETFTYSKVEEGIHPGIGNTYKKLKRKNNPRIMIELPMPSGWMSWVPMAKRQISWVEETRPLVNSTYHWNYVVNGIGGLWPPLQFQLGKELSKFPSKHTIALLQSLGIDTIIINERIYKNGVIKLINKMKQYKQLEFEYREGSISVWHLKEGQKAVKLVPQKHIKLINKANKLIIEVKDKNVQFIFNDKAAAKWKFPIAKGWKIIIETKSGSAKEYEWDTPAIFHNKNNHYELGYWNNLSKVLILIRSTKIELY